MNRAPRFNKWMADVIRPYVGDRVLEIGAGIGNISVHMMPRSIYWATDVQHALSGLSRQFAFDATRICESDTPMRKRPRRSRTDKLSIGDLSQRRRASFPTTLAALRNIWNILEPGGRAIILVPCGPELYGTLDEVLGHCRRYTEDQSGRRGAAGWISRGTNPEVQSARRVRLVAERPHTEKKNIRAGSDSNAEYPHAAFSPCGRLAAASSAFNYRDTQKRGIEPAP